jgi:hypothetical protein
VCLPCTLVQGGRAVVGLGQWWEGPLLALEDLCSTQYSTAVCSDGCTVRARLGVWR